MAALYSAPAPAPKLPPYHFYPPSVSAKLSPIGDGVNVKQNAAARPLPSIPEPHPQFLYEHKQSPSTSTVRPKPSSMTAPKRVLSSFTPRLKTPSSLLALVKSPPILAVVLAHLDWIDAYPLFSTCKITRDLFHDPALRDVILARFVPGYAHSLRARDMNHYHDVPVSVHDLDLLLISQKYPLHQYPTHALRTLSSLYPTFEDDEITSKLVALTQSHSRFVLLLQSLVHSSSQPMPLEPEELQTKSRFLPVQSLRELTFPAPLAYTQLPSSTPPPVRSSTRHKHSKSQPTNGSANSSLLGEFGMNAATLKINPAHGPSANSLSSMMMMSTNGSRGNTTIRKGRGLSIFGKNAYGISPPPPEEPKTLKIYSTTWRRRHESVDFGSLKRPSRRFASADASSDSSVSGPPSIAGRDSPLSSPGVPGTSPHDLTLATCRTRAPVLRVFVPCTKLEDGDESIVLCERQLEDAGLWGHLSTGDVVCNLGYIQPSPDDTSSDDIPVSMLDNPRRSQSIRDLPPSTYTSPGGSRDGGSTSQGKWLLFNGHFLIPYTPPDLLPLTDPLSLPSPFYYTHITPPHAANMTYIIPRLPVCDDVPQLTLVHSTSKVRSPHSPKGYALVKRFAWTARVVRMRTEEGADLSVGEGWFGEWVLEYEATKEGKQVLLDALAGRMLGRRVWELVREKSGAGKIWLRLLPS